MNLRNDLDRLELSSDAVSRISLILDKVVTGQDEVLVSPLANERNPEDILKGWDDIFNHNLSKMNKVLIDLEVSNRSKYGPRSIAIPWEDRRESLTNYFGNSQLGLDLAGGEIKLHGNNRLRSLNLHNAIPYLKNSSNTGLPFMNKKGNIKEALNSPQLMSYLLERRDPCVLFTRTQEGNKTRNVWGYPVADTVLEMCFYRPLLEFQKRRAWRSALLTPQDVDESITYIIDLAQRLNESLLSIDFSSFDATVQYGLQFAAFDYMKGLFQSSEWPIIDQLFLRFNTIGVLTPDGIMSGPHGVPSGSTFTNEVDSIAQYLVASKSGIITHPNEEFCQIQGDDGAYVLKDPDALMENFVSYGLKVNTSKSYVADNYIIYLQSLFHTDYRNNNGLIGGIYPCYRALARIIYLERFNDFSKDEISGQDYFAIRTLTILENCKNHPLFKELVKYVYDLDKYKLKYSDLGLRNYIQAISRQEGKDITFRNWSYGENLSGINSFESVKLIKEFV